MWVEGIILKDHRDFVILGRNVGSVLIAYADGVTGMYVPEDP